MGGDTYKVPEYTKFSSIKGIPQLEQLEKELAKKGLKDPWISYDSLRCFVCFAADMGTSTKTASYRLMRCDDYVFKLNPDVSDVFQQPWLARGNEVWRYHPGFGTKLLRARKLFFRGFPLGLLLTVVTVAVEKAIGGDDHHDHAEH